MSLQSFLAICLGFLLHSTELTTARSVPTSGNTLSASLVRRSKSSVVLDFEAERKALLAKYGKKHQEKRLSTRQKEVQSDMVNQNTDILYYATINVGTPPQSYAVILDTGSSDMWLQSTTCVQCTGKTFDPASSSSLSNSSTPFSISYGIGSAKGTAVSDVVSIGSSGFTIQDQVWGLVNNNLGTPIPGNIAGIMGLGFKNLAASQATPFWEALVSSGQWVEPAMSFWMTRHNNVSNANDAEFGGEFIMGGTNGALYTGDIDYVGLTYPSNPTFWAIPIQRITVNGHEVAASNSSSSALAAIDTATSLIGGPPDVVKKLYAAVPKAKRGNGTLEGFWTYPCSYKVALTINFGGRTWPMTSDDFALATNNPSVCVGAIFETTLGDNDNAQIPQWYIGASFLKNVYSVFRYDPPAVGFAQLSAAALKGEPVPLAPSATASARSANASGASNAGLSRTLPPMCASIAAGLLSICTLFGL
ncbi:acid protease [Ceratobasidium sp. AG-I]|nr:acid protease [Ceratobasidium sp. AG-I]